MPTPVTAPETIAVTGATGFIGRALCQHLLDKGFVVRALVRKPGQAATLATAGVSLVEGSLSNQQSLNTLVTGCHAVVHCAGAVRGARQQDFDRVNVDGLRLLVKAMREHSPASRLLALSSLAASEPQLSFYATSKFRGEQLLLNEAGALSWTILRPPAVYGPGDKELLPLFKTTAKGILPVPGAIESRISIIHVDDLVSAIVAWLQSGQTPGEIYAVDDGQQGGYDWQEIADRVSTITGRRVRLLPIPGFILDAFAWTNRSLARLLGYAPMLTTEKLRELRHPDWVCGNEDFSQRFDWHPKLDLQQGLEQTPGWR